MILKNIAIFEKATQLVLYGDQFLRELTVFNTVTDYSNKNGDKMHGIFQVIHLFLNNIPLSK